ncbi:Hypothetical predicted protein [Mytilus galloprovincialis]|uniref:Integrase zinc-binding domain-containing protein n=1 Tax=Mytilus galloprovincialis TaxID=29158 RepID=A0A8B6EPE7_MYTGA|nr:Hypothetical predicted protein [Mytilus galloprovincialis]
MRLKYYFPNMYKELHKYVDQCATCQTRSYKTSKPPLLETDIPPYAFAKVGLDLSGPYPKTLSGDTVYLKNHRKTSKLDNKWTPYYRIIEQTSPVSYKLKNQLTNKTTKAHARHIRLANLEWDIPKENLGKTLRKSVYVVPPNDSDDDESSDVETSKAKMTKWARYEREDWSSEDDIPLMEFKKKT